MFFPMIRALKSVSEGNWFLVCLHSWTISSNHIISTLPYDLMFARMVSILSSRVLYTRAFSAGSSADSSNSSVCLNWSNPLSPPTLNKPSTQRTYYVFLQDFVLQCMAFLPTLLHQLVLLTLDMQKHHLGIQLKCRFWFTRSGVRPKNLHV